MTTRASKPLKLSNPLVFVDTNILLDFYRARNDQHFAILPRLRELHEVLIMTCQVEMEFKRNRQRVMMEALRSLKVEAPTAGCPSYLRNSKADKRIQQRLRQARNDVEVLRKQFTEALMHPRSKDRVYQIVDELFGMDTNLNLRRDGENLATVRELAQARASMGYPPRKDTDVSFGDALNWEWIIACATALKSDVVIVSRDADFGVSIGERTFINDWLLCEFKERVGARRNVVLTNLLTTALQWFERPVTEEQVAGERETTTEPTVAEPLARFGENIDKLRAEFPNAEFEVVEPKIRDWLREAFMEMAKGAVEEMATPLVEKSLNDMRARWKQLASTDNKAGERESR